MLTDAQGLAVSTDNPATIAAIDRFVHAALAYGTDFMGVVEALDDESDSVMAGSLAAVLMMFFEAGNSADLGLPYLDAARKGVDGATYRERDFFAATEAWVAGDIDTALARLDGITDRHPRDVMAMKLMQYHHFNLGRPDGMLAASAKVLDANADNGFVLGCHAFALEQMNRLDEAEVFGRKATEIHRADPWAHHAVAHVMETQGRLREGIDWMEGLADTWADCNSFMLGHNWWHVALYYLDLEDHARVLDLYDNRIWGIDKTYSQDQANAVSLLWRLELRGVDVGDRWGDVADHVAGRTSEHVQPFLDLHYLFALARAGRDAKAAEMLDSIAAHVDAAPAAARTAWREVALPAARGVAAFARGDLESAYADLARAEPRLQEIGGSHAQRDLFVQTWLETLLRTGCAAEALPILRQRAEIRPSAPANRWLERAIHETGGTA